MQLSPRIRKDIRAVPPFQRARFFYCLKLLTVLPPRQGPKRSFYVAWKVQNGQRFFKTVIPSNIHDQFIASHQTCCEHGAPYFPYYHRHMLISLEIELNYAEQVLLAGKNKLTADFYKAYAPQLDAVFTHYKSIIASFRKESGLTAADKLPQISIHYWNATDYTQDILIPSELSPHQPDDMDNLCFAVNKHYPWNFNFATRWFRDQGLLPKGFETNGFFLNEPANYNTTEQLILNGQLNPRTNNTDRFFWGTSNTETGIFGISDTAAKVNAYKNYQTLTTNGDMDICAMQQNELNALFGSSKSNLQWINKAERAKMNSLSGQTLALAYNRMLPHYQYAYALFKSSNGFLKNYVSTYNQNYENSFENAHNTIHNSLQLFMSDSQLSITNPLFFLYHSWIDLALETKIRLIRTSEQNSKEAQATRQFLDNIKPNSVLDQVTAPTGPITYGNYNIFEWALPISRLQTTGLILKPTDYQVAFPGKGYVFNQQANAIRRSDQLQSFYQTNYSPNVAARYSNFTNFSRFNYNYNYQIADYDAKGIVFTLMQGNVVPVHSYIRAIYNEYGNEWNGNLTRTVTAAPPPSTSLFSADRIELTSTPQPSSALTEQQYYDEKYLLRAIRASILGYATYSSTVRSTVLPILLEVTPQGFQEIAFNEQEIQVMKTGLIISTVPLLTRGSGAIVCPNCKVEKELWLECSENLAEMNEALFCTIARGLNREVIYRVRDNKVDNIRLPKLNDLFRLHTPRPVFNTLRLVQGAVEVSFVVNFQGKQDYKTSSVKINGFSYEMQSQKLHNIASKKKQNLKCEIQLPRVIGIELETQHSRYTYRLIKVFITNGPQYREFEFPINTYHELIRYRIDIFQREDAHDGYLDVTVRDLDYAFKERHYASNQYEI